MGDIIMTQHHRYTFGALDGTPVLVDSSDHAGDTTIFNNKVEIQDINGDTSGQLTILGTNTDTQYGPHLFMRQMGAGDVGICMYDGTATWSVGIDSSAGTELRFCNSATQGTNTEMKIATDGTLSVTGDVIAYASSDKKLKNNLILISNPLDRIRKIGGYEFDWNDNQDTYSGHDVGVVAQEIQEVLPEVISKREDGYLAVKYEKIVPLLIEGIKEQQKQIESLEARIKKLENK